LCHEAFAPCNSGGVAGRPGRAGNCSSVTSPSRRLGQLKLLIVPHPSVPAHRAHPPRGPLYRPNAFLAFVEPRRAPSTSCSARAGRGLGAQFCLWRRAQGPSPPVQFFHRPLSFILGADPVQLRDLKSFQLESVFDDPHPHTNAPQAQRYLSSLSRGRNVIF